MESQADAGSESNSKRQKTDESSPKEISNGAAVTISEAAKRQNMIETELNGMIKEMMDSEDFEEEDEMEPESYEAIMRAAKEICYTRKYYDVSADKIVFFPSVTKTVINMDLFEKAEEYYFDEGDEFPAEYSMGIRNVTFEKLEAEGDDDEEDDEMDDDMMERLSMAVQLTENDRDELREAMAAAEAIDEEEEAEQDAAQNEDSAMDPINTQVETSSEPLANHDTGEPALTEETYDQAPSDGETKKLSVAEELAALKNRNLTKSLTEKLKDADGLSTPEQEEAALQKITQTNRTPIYKKDATESLKMGTKAMDQDLAFKQKQIAQKKEDMQKKEEAAKNLQSFNSATVVTASIAPDNSNTVEAALTEEEVGNFDRALHPSDDTAETSNVPGSVSEQTSQTEAEEEKQDASTPVEVELGHSLHSISESSLAEEGNPVIRELEDTLYYSDDSESLSDVYFHPTPSDGKKSYGSIEQHRSSYEPNQPSIMEDSPVTQSSALLPSTSNFGTNQTRAKQKRRNRRMNRNELQEEREREVTRIRGEVQSPSTYHGIPWAILFVIQLLFVFACAVYYGLTLVKPAGQPLNVKNRRLGNFDFVDNLMLKAGNEDSNETIISQAIKHTSSNTTTVLHSKDMKNLQDDDFILSQSASTTKAKGVSTSPVEEQVEKSQLPNLSDPTSANPKLFRIDYRNVVSIFSVSGFYACVISYLSFGVILSLAQSVIPVILIFSVTFAFCWSMFGLALFPSTSSTVIGFVGLFLALGYAISSWQRIPFCSVNLKMAMCALRDTRGILFIGIGSLFVVFLWLLVWLVALIGIFNMSNAKECQLNTVDCRTHLVMEEDRYFELAILVLSLFWTSIVIKNVVRTTIAGACGAWWFGLHETSHGWACFNSIIWSQLAQSCSYSFGSICFGSLVEVPAQILSVLSKILCCCKPRSSDQGNADATTAGQGDDVVKKLNSVLPWEQENRTILARISHRLRCCNRWCYTYIGMFSYSYIEGGEKAYQLFSTRGWMVIAEDNLIQNSLIMASIVIGASCGILAILVEEVDGYTFTSLHQPIWTAFWIGAVTGFTLSNILLLGVVGSSINTVMVCFAAEPFEFDKNHPRLSTEMRQVWSALVWESPPLESSSSLLNAGGETA